MTFTSRRRWIAAAAAIVLLAPSTPRLAAQDARAILLEPGQVNASVDTASWWLANQSVVVTWSTAGGGIRLASVYDRLGGRTGPKPGETFTIALPDGRSLAGSTFTLAGRPAVATCLPNPRPAGTAAGKARQADFGAARERRRSRGRPLAGGTG